MYFDESINITEASDILSFDSFSETINFEPSFEERKRSNDVPIILQFLQQYNIRPRIYLGPKNLYYGLYSINSSSIINLYSFKDESVPVYHVNGVKYDVSSNNNLFFATTLYNKQGVQKALDLTENIQIF